MNNVKKNNKGFSLVELIVVVLIMAIISVALAPQVMKWVTNSRLATDVSTYDSLVANCQLALTDADTFTKCYDASTAVVVTVSLDNDGVTITDSDAGDALDAQLAEIIGTNYKDKTVAKVSDLAAPYVITITNGAVDRTTPPDTSSNEDLK